MNEVCSCMASVSAARREIGSPQRVLIALSGGADSVALFCLLKNLADQERFEIAAVHVHHGLRQTADRDAAFCEQLCKQYNVTIFVQHVHPKGRSEEEARKERFNAFSLVYNAWGADVLALAHHASDQAETVLLHLFRGSGCKGLSGMSMLAEHFVNGSRMKLFRPLLGIGKDALTAIAVELHGSFCHDETNDSDCYTRNYLRRQVLPRILERIPQAEAAIGRTAQILQSENDFLDALSRRFIREHGTQELPISHLDYPSFLQQHLALRRRIMQRFLPFDEPFETIDRAAVITAGQSVNLQRGWHLTADSRFICLVPPEKTNYQILPLQKQAESLSTGDGIHTQRMPLKLFEQCDLRYRKPGDFIQPFGMKGTKSLQDYLVDRKVSEPMRDYLPLLCIENEVIWAIGIGASEKVRCKNGEEAVLLRYPSRLPFEKE